MTVKVIGKINIPDKIVKEVPTCDHCGCNTHGSCGDEGNKVMVGSKGVREMKIVHLCDNCLRELN